MKGILAAMAILVAILCAGHVLGYRLNVTPSLAVGVYRLQEGTPQRGDIVSFCLAGTAAELAGMRGYLQPGQCPSGLRPLMKRLAAIPGDQVVILPGGISCISPNGFGCIWPISPQKKDRMGRQIHPAHISGTVPVGMALVLTSYQGGFDSRYFGFVPLAELKKMVPVLTF